MPSKWLKQHARCGTDVQLPQLDTLWGAIDKVPNVLTLPYSHTLTPSHSHTLTLSHSHTLTLLHSHTLTLHATPGRLGDDQLPREDGRHVSTVYLLIYVIYLLIYADICHRSTIYLLIYADTYQHPADNPTLGFGGFGFHLLRSCQTPGLGGVAFQLLGP